jgi:Tfp pilus assembly protein PilW
MPGNILKNKQGQSLMEMIVAVALFSVVRLIVVSIFQTVLTAQRSAITTSNIQENLRYAFETMSKEIRMAQKSDCSIGSGNVYTIANNALYFKNQYGECVSYSLDNNRIKLDRNGNQAYITPEAVKISNLKFLVASSVQPRVTIMADIAVPAKSGVGQTIKIQTTISSRQYK